jgi:enamine deaminase RidA (YjgF/YER057c/UK114 family)
VSDEVKIVKKQIKAPGALCEAYDYPRPVPFSRGLRVEIGPVTMLFISGTASVDERGVSVHAGDFRAQARRMFRNISDLLAAEGASWKDVVKTSCYIADFKYYDEFNEERKAFYDSQGLDPYPASTCVGAALCRPELLVEAEVTAIVGAGTAAATCRASQAGRAGRDQRMPGPARGLAEGRLTTADASSRRKQRAEWPLTTAVASSRGKQRAE